MNPIIDAILSRRSIRKFTQEPVGEKEIETILNCGIWAPSGLNNQPCRYIVVQERSNIVDIADCTHYSDVVLNAPVLIAVFLDKDAMYNYVKDVQAAGASIQNMLLSCHSMGLGAVWLGEILNQKEKVNSILEAPDSFELMAVLAIGHPKGDKRTSSRRALGEMAFNEMYGSNWVERGEEN